MKPLNKNVILFKTKVQNGCFCCQKNVFMIYWANCDSVLFISSSHVIESASCYPEWQKSVKASGMKGTFHMRQLVYESVFSPVWTHVLWTLNLHMTKVLPVHHWSSRLASPQCSASNMSIHCTNPQSQQQPKPACNCPINSQNHNHSSLS